LTGFRTWGEFLRETSEFERELIVRSVEQWHREREDAMPSA